MKPATCSICIASTSPILVVNQNLGVCTTCVQGLAAVPEHGTSKFLSAVWGPNAAQAATEASAPFSRINDATRSWMHAQIPRLRQEIAKNPDDARPVVRLAEFFGALGDIKNSTTAFRAAVAIYVRQNGAVYAVSLVKMLICLEPNSAETRVDLARLYANLGHRANARAEALAAIRLGWPTVLAEALELLLAELSLDERAKLQAAIGR